MAGVNPWMTIGVLSGSNGQTNYTPFLQQLSGFMAPLVTSDGSGGGAGGTYAQQVASQTSDPNATQAQDTSPLFPTKKSNTNKNYKDPRMSSPSWMGGSNLFDDDSHGANVMGQLASRPSNVSPPPIRGGGSSGGSSAGGSSGGGDHGGGGHHGGHDNDHHGGGGWGGWGWGGFGHHGLLGGFGHFGRWW